MLRRVERVVLVWAVFSLLCSVYLVTYRGLFQSIDELTLYAMTESLVQAQSLQTPQLAFARYHNQVGRLEPLQSVVAAPLYWLAVRSGWLGSIHTVMLLNVLVTAATGAILCVLLACLGHPVRRAVLGALVYGLVTIAWPYSRGFFREPLLALLLLTATLGWVRWRQTGWAGFAILAAACLVVAPVAKVTAALAWPAFGLAFVLEPGMTAQVRLRRLLPMALIGLVAGFVLAVLYAARRDVGVWTVWQFLRSWADPIQVLTRAFGLLFGSGRGLFVYSPVLLLALPGLVTMWRQRRAEAILAACAPVAFVLGYSSYPDWHGGLVWGARFLVPVIPVLMLPVVECFSVRRLGWRLALGVLVAASGFIQLTASTVDYSIQVTGSRWASLTDYVRSPVVQQIGLWHPDNFDMLWWHGPLHPHLAQAYVNGWIVLLPAAVLAGAVALMVAVLRGSGAGGGKAPRPVLWMWSVLLGVVLVAGILVLLWQAPTVTGGYAGTDPSELRAVAQIVNRDGTDCRTIVTVSNEFHINVLLDGFKGCFVHHWLSPMQEDGFEVLAKPAQYKMQPLASVQRLYLVVDRVHLPADRSGREARLWLDTRMHRFAADWVGGGYEVYGYLYPTPLDDTLVEVDYRWAAGMEMSAYRPVPGNAAPGDLVRLTFRLSADQELDADYDMFLQLLGPDGRFVDGIDGPPQFGAAPTSRWEPGQVIVDRRAVRVPEDAPEGTYRVIAGFYRGGERQALVDGDGRPVGTHLELGEIEVRP
jgi:hypothetical protein